MKVKAAVLYSYNEPMKIETLEMEDPKANEVMVKVKACGVCHSDLHVLKGEIKVNLPAVVGHEAAGIVEKVGPGVTSVKPGDPVVLSWCIPCGKCELCLEGRGNICQVNLKYNVATTMLDGTTRLRNADGETVHSWLFIGGFAEYVVAPEQGVIPLRADAPFDIACLFGCCVPTGFGSVVTAAQLRPGQSVAIFGCGGVGLNGVDGARAVGAKHIFAVDVHDEKEEIARAFGATHFINSTKDDPVKVVMDVTNGRGVDVAFDFRGDTGIQEWAFWTVKMGGKLILTGVPAEEEKSRMMGYFITNHEKVVQGSLYGSTKPRTDIPRLIDMYMDGKLTTDKLVTRRIRLEDVNEALSLLREEKVQGRQVIVFDD